MIIIGSRGSALALAQATWTQKQIQTRFPDIEVAVEIIKTSGDKDVTSSLRAPSTVGVFVKEIEQALLDGKIDIAVHSMKDLPTEIPDGLHIAAVPEREDTRDALITNLAADLARLPAGARVGTGSLRRQAQILTLRPDLNVMDIRGNLDTRLKKLRDGAYDAIILACAGLRRLGLQNQISSILEHSQMLPAPGQGALAIEARKGDSRIEAIAAELNHRPTALAVFAERSFLQNMGGGCNVPVGVHGHIEQNVIQIDALVASPDGQRVVRDSIRHDAEKFKEAVAVISQRILSSGGRDILKETSVSR
jgi:hydroxymethylbilane synthase